MMGTAAINNASTSPSSSLSGYALSLLLPQQHAGDGDGMGGSSDDCDEGYLFPLSSVHALHPRLMFGRIRERSRPEDGRW